MKSFGSFIFGARFLFGLASTLFVTSPVAQASCLDEFQENCDNSGGSHHVVRRSVSSSSLSNSLKVDFVPVVHNVTYYNNGDEISFTLNLTHNQSAPAADLTNDLKVVLSSQFLKPKASFLVVNRGSISAETYNSSAISFDIATLNQNDEVSVIFAGTVKGSIHPLANLYFVVQVTGQDGSNNDYHYGPVASSPTLYAVFPKVSLSRTSYSNLWVGNTTSYTMTISMPHLNFSLVVEISTAINDFSFMEVTNVQVTSVGQNIIAGASGGSRKPSPQYDSSEEVSFNDRTVLDFGNLTVASNDESKNKIVISYNVTIRDNPLLANNSKHWVGAGMRSGYQMLWVGQEAICVYKTDPSVVGEITALNDTTSQRYLIGDKLYVSWTVNHTYNTSYDDAQDVRISFNSDTLKLLSGKYVDSADGTEKPLRISPDAFHSEEFVIATFNRGSFIRGDIELEVSDKISPLVNLDVFMKLSYKNKKGEEKLNTTHKVTPPYVAGVPVFSLKLNSSTNQIRIGERATFFFTILMRKIVSTLSVEVILPVNESSPIMSLTHLRVVSVGTSIERHSVLSQVQPQFNSTVGDPKLYDRATVNFGTVKSVGSVGDSAKHEIVIEFGIVVNDHANVTNGSKHWVGVGVRGGERMVWIGEAALIAEVPVDRRPLLTVSGSCVLPGTQLSCSDATTLTKSSKVYFNGTVYHDAKSQQYADNVNVLWMIPPYVTFTELQKDPGITYLKTEAGPKFTFNNRLHFLDRLSFSVEGELDPTGIMPPGDTYAVSPIQLTYSPESVSAVFAAPLAPVTLKFKSPGDGAPQVTPNDLPEVYSRGFLLDKTNSIVYICQKANDRLKASCFSTSDAAVSWMAIDQQVCQIVGQDGEVLYAIACNGRAYMRRLGPNRAWYSIDKKKWEEAKANNVNISQNLRKIPDNYSNSGDIPVPNMVLMLPAGTEWGATMKGVFMKTSGGGWTLKAQWKCCGN